MSDTILNLTVLISGNGSNFQALIDACADSTLPHAKITHVISNRKNAYGLIRASNASIPSSYHNLVPYKKKHVSTPEGMQSARDEYDADLASLILRSEPRPDLIVCAGWMHILAPTFLNPMTEAGIRVINLHPALPGEFSGAGAIERAWQAYQNGEIKRTGVMIHEVIAEVDAGAPIITQEIELKGGESLGELEKRIHEVEHVLIVEGTKRTLAELEEKKKSQNLKQV